MDKSLTGAEVARLMRQREADSETLNQQDCCCQDCSCKDKKSDLTREELARQLYLLSTLRDDDELHLWTNGIIACDSGMFDRNLSGVVH